MPQPGQGQLRQFLGLGGYWAFAQSGVSDMERSSQWGPQISRSSSPDRSTSPARGTSKDIDFELLFEQQFEASERSWHDVVQPDVLAKDSTLKETKAPGGGTITVSDIVLRYQRG